MKKLNEIQQKLNVPKKRWNKFGEYHYRNQEDILEAVKPLLGDATLTLRDEMIALGQGEHTRFYVNATATLTDGDEQVFASAQARETFSRKKMDDPQLTGTASSYARKYALNGLFGLDDVKDPDATNKHGKEGIGSAGLAPAPVKDPWGMVAKKAGVTVKVLKEKLKPLGIIEDDQLMNFGSDAAIKVIKGEE
jgi:hypothetical protein